MHAYDVDDDGGDGGGDDDGGGDGDEAIAHFDSCLCTQLN